MRSQRRGVSMFRRSCPGAAEGVVGRLMASMEIINSSDIFFEEERRSAPPDQTIACSTMGRLTDTVATYIYWN